MRITAWKNWTRHGLPRILKPDGKLILVKDKAVPGSIAALKTLRMALDLSGYNLIDQNEINKEDVSFVLFYGKTLEAYGDLEH